ncbi:MAG: molybdenum ABC transporter ATP-binding protein [Pseudomonadota bacterium]
MLDLAIRRDLPGFALDVAFTASPGVTAIFGPSGAGKTTLARCLAGLERPDAGHVRLGERVLFGEDVDVPPHRRGVGYVFQEARLFPHVTVRGNLLYGAPRGTDPAAMAKMLDIAPLLDRRPGGLSGGEAARVAIGRALLRAPSLLILDEPLAALDARRREGVLPYLERLRDMGMPILYISHAIEEVARLATTLVLLRDGRVRHIGSLSEMLSDPEIAAELGPRQAGAVLDGRVLSVRNGIGEVETAAGRLHLAGVALGARIRIRIRAEDVIVATEQPTGLSALNVLPARIEGMQTGRGPGVMIRLSAREGALLARVTQRSVETMGLRVGMSCWAVLKTSGVAPQDVGQGSIDP